MRGTALPQSPPVASAVGVGGPSLDHLFWLTDSAGMIQHSLFSTPDPKHGYCIDDNARGLRFVVRHFRLFADLAVLPLAYTYLSFIRYAQTGDGRFHNFMSFDRDWLDEVGSQDSFGRTIMGLCTAVALAPEPGIGLAAAEILEHARPQIRRLTAPRSVAFSMLGLAQLSGQPDWAAVWSDTMGWGGEYLASLYRRTAGPDWKWFEDIVTYSNARLPQALLTAAAILGESEFVEIGRESLDFYLDLVIDGGRLDLIGHDGWLPRGGSRAAYGQQPVDAGGLVEACLTAARATGETRHVSSAYRAMAWYTGNNRLGLPLIDPQTGGCADGLNASGLNSNQGAESLLSYLNARLAIEEFERGLA